MRNSSIILDESELIEVRDFFLDQPGFVFDVEAAGENRGVPHLNSLTWMSMSARGKVAVIPFGHPLGSNIIGYDEEKIKWGKGTRTIKLPKYDAPPKQIDRGTVFEILSPVFLSERLEKTAHGAIYDLASVAKYLGFVPVPPYGCTVTEQWILDENFTQTKKLKDQTKQKYGFAYDDEDVGKEIEKYPFDICAYYSYCDALYPSFLHAEFMEKIREQELMHIHELEMDIINVCVGMKLDGAHVDVPRVRELREELAGMKADAVQKIELAAGHTFNLNSPRQKQEVLFNEQGLKPWKLTKGGMKKKKAKVKTEFTDYSVDDEVLESLAGNAVVDGLREYGDVDRLLGTYVDPWLNELIYDEHIHADFVPYGTVTGRFSCREPNLQNIPRPSSELGRKMRGVFDADDDEMLVVADYSQIELVILAHHLGQGKLFDGFWAGIDPHRIHAAGVLGKSPEEVTAIERQDLGKTLGFAICYGAGVRKVASMAHVSEARAKEILGKYDIEFPEVRAYKSAVLRTAKRRNPPYVETLLGRRRRLPGLISDDKAIRSYAERQGFNAKIQGGAADLIKLAMVRLDSSLPPEVRLRLTVHDEIVLSSPRSMADGAANILRDAMTGPGIQKLIGVPLKADIKIVSSWDQAK